MLFFNFVGFFMSSGIELYLFVINNTSFTYALLGIGHCASKYQNIQCNNDKMIDSYNCC